LLVFDSKISQDEYNQHLEQNTILDVMHHEAVKSGDSLYISTGRVHAIGAGVLLTENQQTSDIFYRIYDYDRVDTKNGSKRELHNNLAIDVLDYEDIIFIKPNMVMVRIKKEEDFTSVISINESLVNLANLLMGTDSSFE